MQTRLIYQALVAVSIIVVLSICMEGLFLIIKLIAEVEESTIVGNLTFQAVKSAIIKVAVQAEEYVMMIVIVLSL